MKKSDLNFIAIASIFSFIFLLNECMSFSWIEISWMNNIERPKWNIQCVSSVLVSVLLSIDQWKMYKYSYVITNIQ